jgi:hypothetical protein
MYGGWRPEIDEPVVDGAQLVVDGAQLVGGWCRWGGGREEGKAESFFGAKFFWEKFK